MPRTGPQRRMIGVKLSDAGIDWLTERAEAEGLLMKRGTPNRSELLRIMVTYAQRNMPEGWRP